MSINNVVTYECMHLLCIIVVNENATLCIQTFLLQTFIHTYIQMEKQKDAFCVCVFVFLCFFFPIINFRDKDRQTDRENE